MENYGKILVNNRLRYYNGKRTQVIQKFIKLEQFVQNVLGKNNVEVRGKT